MTVQEIYPSPEAADAICQIGSRLWQRGLIAASDGNISVRIDADHILCTPSGISKGFLTANDLVLINLAGEKITGQREASSEIRMHLAVYTADSAIQAVVHAHPPHATAFALAEKSLPAGLMPEIDVLLGKVALVPFIQPGTQQIADAVGSVVNSNCHAALLARHGATTWGTSLEQAWIRMESLDQCCHIVATSKNLG